MSSEDPQIININETFNKLKNELQALNDWREYKLEGHPIKFSKEALNKWIELVAEYANRLLLAAQGNSMINNIPTVRKRDIAIAPSRMNEHDDGEWD